MQQLGEIRISGGYRLTIDIEGLIGVPEWWQFDGESQRAATYDSFRSQLDRIGRSGARKIQVNIRSTGGNVHDALLIYDTLCTLAAEGAEITTTCYGYVASSATVIAQAATPGRRLVSTNALYLIHNATTALDGNRIDAERTARLLDKTDERIALIYAFRSGQPVEQYRELMARDGGRGEWLTPTETVAAGLADRVSRSSSLVAVRDRVAGAIRNLLGGAPASPLPEPAVVPALRPFAAPADGAARFDPGDELRMNVRASATLPCEDPTVVTAGLLEFGSADTSRNGVAYEGDALRLRGSC